MHPRPRVQHPSTVSLRLKFQVVEVYFLYLLSPPYFFVISISINHRRVDPHTHCIVVIAH